MTVWQDDLSPDLICERKREIMAAACVLFCSDGVDWCDYFINYLQRVFPNIEVEQIKEPDFLQLCRLPKSRSRSAMMQSKVNIFIISPCYLQFFIENPNVTFRELPCDGKVVIFLCGTTLDDFVIEDANGHKINDRFPRFDKQSLLSYPHHDEMLEQVVGMLESDSGSGKDEVSTLSKNDNKPLPKSNGKFQRKRKTKGFKLIPKEVNCEGTSDVIISFDELVASEDLEVKVEVEIEGGVDDDASTRITAVCHNPYTYSFKAPAHRAGTLRTYLFSNGKAIGSEELVYTSPLMDAIKGIHQIYIQQINELCYILNHNQLLTPEVDRALSKVLRDEAEAMIPAGAFEYFHGAYRFQDSDSSDAELPTMFHLAAKYGLHELGQRLTDLPDARYSYCTYNVNRQLPEDIAKSYNYSGLATIFENFREGDTFKKLYDSYIIMNQAKMSPLYLNPSSRKEEGGSDDDYDYEDVPSELEMSMVASQRFLGKKHAPTAATAKTSGVPERASKVKAEDDGKTCSISAKYVDDMENPYECRYQKQLLDVPVPFVEGVTTIPKNQQELISIMDGVKHKQLTMSEAEVLFKEWQIRHQKKPASIKQKESQLAKIREETERAQKEKKDSFPFTHLLGKKGGALSSNSSIPEIMPGTKKPTKSAAAEATDRSSTTSSSSRESTCSRQSRTSVTSGIDVDETIQEETGPKLPPRPKFSRRKSIRLQKLEQELKSPSALEPPPIPPRVIGQTGARPSVPLPKFERTVAAGAKAPNASDSSRIPCEEEPTCPSTTSDDLYVIMENVPNPETESPSVKGMIHQESLPEYGNPPWVCVGRNSSLPNILQLPGDSYRKHEVPAVPEEEDEPELKQNPPLNVKETFRLPPYIPKPQDPAVLKKKDETESKQNPSTEIPSVASRKPAKEDDDSKRNPPRTALKPSGPPDLASELRKKFETTGIGQSVLKPTGSASRILAKNEVPSNQESDVPNPIMVQLKPTKKPPETVPKKPK